MHTGKKPVIYFSLAVSTVFHIALIIYLSRAVGWRSEPGETPIKSIPFKLHYNRAAQEQAKNESLYKSQAQSESLLKSNHSQRRKDSPKNKRESKGSLGKKKENIESTVTESRSITSANVTSIKDKDIKPFDSASLIEAHISSNPVHQALPKIKPVNPKVFSPELQKGILSSQKLNTRPMPKNELIDQYISSDQSTLLRKGDSCLRVVENKQWGDKPQWWIVRCPYSDKSEALSLNE